MDNETLRLADLLRKKICLTSIRINTDQCAFIRVVPMVSHRYLAITCWHDDGEYVAHTTELTGPEIFDEQLTEEFLASSPEALSETVANLIIGGQK